MLLIGVLNLLLGVPGFVLALLQLRDRWTPRKDSTVTDDPRFPNGAPLNGCSACRRDFASLAAFDQHRQGSHAYDWSPEHEDGRRCLPVDELPEWFQNDRDRWTTTKLAEQAAKLAQHHAGASMEPSDATEAA